MSLRSFKTSSFPPPVRRFLLRATGLFIGWKLLYWLVLIPHEVPDAWLVRQLGSGTAATMNVLYQTDSFTVTHTRRTKVYGQDTVFATYSMVERIRPNGTHRELLGIFQACNGLELMILYAGFIICFTGSWRRKLVYIVAGVLGLYFLNVLRCAFLGYIVLEHPQRFEIAHKYIFNLVVYALTFLLWVMYVSGLKQQHETASAPTP